MGRLVRDANLSTREARKRLKPRSKPYWRLLEHGRHIGYRKTRSGGSWLARLYKGERKYIEERLGTADDTTDADNVQVLDWAAAQRRAHRWLVSSQRALDEGDHPNRFQQYTIADAVNGYLAWYAVHRKAYSDAKQCAEAHILPTLGQLVVEKLRPEKLRKWHEALAVSAPRLRSKLGQPQNRGPRPTDSESRRRRKVTANRVLSVLKAALNHAYEDGKISSNRAWVTVRPFKDVDSARHRFLTRDEAIRLLNASDPPFRDLVQGALHTGARYGELSRLRVRDYRNTKVFVAISKSGKSRWIGLTAEGRGFFEQVCIGRLPDELMFLRAGRNGEPIGWGRSHQNDFMRRACERAGIEPLGFHQLRHTYASLCLMSGLPLLVLAKNLGHVDTRMVEKHYGHLLPSYEDQMIEEHAPQFGLVRSSETVRLPLTGTLPAVSA